MGPIDAGVNFAGTRSVNGSNNLATSMSSFLMKKSLLTLTLTVAAFLPADAAPKKVVVVTATKGFRHSSIATAENVIATLGETTGEFTVVDFVRGGPKGTDDADVQQKLSLDHLQGIDAVIFANTTGDLAIPDRDGFLKWVANGHGFVAMHAGGDTFHGFRGYVEMLGGEFVNHGPQVQVDAYNQDPAHPATRNLGPIYTVFDEIYEFKSFDRSKVHGLLTLDKHPQTHVPSDYPVSWCKDYGTGKVFYTSLGHREDVWSSAAYQQHILGGIEWALGLAPGNGKPIDTANHLSAQEAADGFKLLFNGTDLSGWKYRSEDGPKSWSAQNGMLCNVFQPGGHGTDIYTDSKFRDFILRYEYQIPPKSNSGVYLRGRYEIQIFDDAGDGHDKGKNGDIYNVASCSLLAARKPGQWQTVEARIVGQKITVILNGIKVHDGVVVDHATGGGLDDNTDQPGPILIQGDHGQVGFRNVQIKPLN